MVDHRPRITLLAANGESIQRRLRFIATVVCNYYEPLLVGTYTAVENINTALNRDTYVAAAFETEDSSSLPHQIRTTGANAPVDSVRPRFTNTSNVKVLALHDLLLVEACWRNVVIVSVTPVVTAQQAELRRRRGLKIRATRSQIKCH
ncbi:hypothetical protein EVAR_21948_1 [Eumeta japonica]|uniref:Uncharacterized protein n=1 Tax=Eumeta variegata TaxID=151549 RepID=A0A4C1VV90_EUMVA|nr:hypothetical protein EVAR_21948_1 [Eumeta japonica]